MAEVFNLPTKEQFDTMNSHLGNIAAPDAAKVTIEDTGSHYTSGNVEGALREVGERINDLEVNRADNNQPACKVTNSANISIVSGGSGTIVNLDTEVFDTDDMFTVGTNKIVVKTAGIYLINACVSWASNSTGMRLARLRKNGSIVLTQSLEGADSAGFKTQNITTLVDLSVNDYIELLTIHTAGTAIDIVKENFSPVVTVVKVGELT